MTTSKTKETGKTAKHKNPQYDRRNNKYLSSTSCTLSTFLCETICVAWEQEIELVLIFSLLGKIRFILYALVDGDWISARLEFWCFGEMCKVVARIPRQNCNWLECAVIGLFKAWNLIKLYISIKIRCEMMQFRGQK